MDSRLSDVNHTDSSSVLSSEYKRRPCYQTNANYAALIAELLVKKIYALTVRVKCRAANEQHYRLVRVQYFFWFQTTKSQFNCLKCLLFQFL